MTEYIILSNAEMLELCANKPVTAHIDKKPYVLCTDEYFNEQIKPQKKRDLANEHIVDLVTNLIGYMQGYVGSANCPYKYDLLGAKEIKKPANCSDCETCKHDFWLDLESKLLDKNVVE